MITIDDIPAILEEVKKHKFRLRSIMIGEVASIEFEIFDEVAKEYMRLYFSELSELEWEFFKFKKCVREKFEVEIEGLKTEMSKQTKQYEHSMDLLLERIRELEEPTE